MSTPNKIEVTFKTQTGHIIVEVMDRANGSNQAYSLRALAMGWSVVEVRDLG